MISYQKSNSKSYFKRWIRIKISFFFEKQLFFIEKVRIKRILNKNRTLVLIYTIGKVGSSSIYKSLQQKKEFKNPVFHLHFLNPLRIEEQKKYYKQSERKSIPFHLIQSTVLSKLLQSYKGKIIVFTLIREPIQRELSSLFQDSFNFTNSKDLIGAGIKEVVQKKIELLVDRLPEEKWFDEELKHVLGFDIFSMDFNPEKGFVLSKKDNIHIALIRLENLKKCFTQITIELFDKDYGFELRNANMSENKFYEKDYKEIKEYVKLPKEELDKLLSSRFIQKFYTDYILTIYERWSLKK